VRKYLLTDIFFFSGAKLKEFKSTEQNPKDYWGGG